MVRKIQANEYLQRYDNMTAQQRQEYESRVGQWLSDNGNMLAVKGGVFEARMQNILQVSATWNDQESRAFEEGARLLSALVPLADTWLPDMLYTKSAKRAIKQMYELLWSVDEGQRGEQHDDAPAAADDDSMRMQSGAAKEAVYTIKADGATSVSPEAKSTTTTDGSFQDGAAHGDIVVGDNKAEVQVKAAPVRPRHFDQYAHLLPEKTQGRIAKYGPLMRELEEVRQKMNLLMNDKTASAGDREAWAKRATAIDKELGGIKREADAEWDKLVKAGRVMLDDLGNAHIVECPAPESAEETAPVELTPEQKARRRDLRKWLTDTRRGNGATREEYMKKWKENFREYLTLEGDTAFKDEKVMAAMAHYGIKEEELR